MDEKFNAMIFLQKYSATNIFIFDQVNKIQEVHGKISFSVIVIIETERIDSFQPYCVCMLYESSDGEQGRLDVLSEISLEQWPQSVSSENGVERVNSSALCNFQCRRTFKLNVKEKESYGPGRYALILVNSLAVDIDNNVSYAFQHQVSNVCFEVIPEKEARGD